MIVSSSLVASFEPVIASTCSPLLKKMNAGTVDIANWLTTDSHVLAFTYCTIFDLKFIKTSAKEVELISDTLIEIHLQYNDF